MNTENSRTHASSDFYWNALKDLGVRDKIDLINKLSASLLVTVPIGNKEEHWASKLAGRWQDERSADEMITDIRSSRTTNREIEL